MYQNDHDLGSTLHAKPDELPTAAELLAGTVDGGVVASAFSLSTTTGVSFSWDIFLFVFLEFRFLFFAVAAAAAVAKFRLVNCNWNVLLVPK